MLPNYQFVMRLFLFLVGMLISNHIYSAATVLVEVIHTENTKVELRDAALHDYLVYDPIFNFPEKTTFGLEDGSFTLLEVDINDESYLLYVKGSFITIDLKLAKIKSDAFFLFKRKKDFFNTDVNGKWLLHLFEIEKFYKGILSEVDSLIQVDNAYGAKENGVFYWDKKSAKKLLSYLKDKNYEDQDFQLRFNSPSYIDFSHLLYQLSYQYSAKEIHLSMSIEDQFSKIMSESIPVMADGIVLHHFFRPSSPLVVMESAVAIPDLRKLASRVQFTAHNAVKLKLKRHDLNKDIKAEWLFGFDVDESLNSFFAKQDVRKPSVIMFWTTFGSAMDYEYHHMRELYQQFSDRYNFIYICVNAYEQEQKAKAIIRREKLSGHHLFPKSADAFWKSDWKDKRINSLPFYIIIDAEENLVSAYEIPMDFSPLLSSSMKFHLKSKEL